MAARGVQFAICENATPVFLRRELQERLAHQLMMSLKNCLPMQFRMLHFISAGVIAATRAQEYGYSLLAVG